MRFRDFLLKPELLRAISDLGFEHPSEGTRLSHRPPTGFTQLQRAKSVGELHRRQVTRRRALCAVASRRRSFLVRRALRRQPFISLLGAVLTQWTRVGGFAPFG